MNGSMSWRCPVCATPIQHNESEATPRHGTRYRCHVCRLELQLNVSTDDLDVIPIEEPPAEAPKVDRRRWERRKTLRGGRRATDPKSH